MLALRSLVIAVLLTLGVVTAGAPVAAQDATEAAGNTTEQVEETAQDVEEETDDFDDWGLLGLLGLAGLAGLFRRPQPVVHETERTRVDSTRL
jgi:hypothetical protein